jgi:hypothetical protein
LSDLLVILVLAILGLAAGWWRLRDPQRSLKQRLDWGWLRRLVQSLVRHRDTQVFVATFLWIATFWLATLNAGGLGAAKRVLDPPAPPTRELIQCRLYQEAMFVDIEDYMRSQGQPAPAFLPSTSCPHGGEYRLDDRGHINCSLHGRAPGLPSVHAVGKPGYTSWRKRY